MDSREIIKRLEAAGFVHVRTRGDHHIFKNDTLRRMAVVPHPVKDIRPGTLRSIEKMSGVSLRKT